MNGVAANLLDLAPMPRLTGTLRSAGLFREGSVTLARAPGRLDVMGGIADYSGALVCQMPLAVAAGVAVQERDDGQLVCRSAQVGRTVTVPIAALASSGAEAVRDLLQGDDRWARYAAGCVWLLVQRGVRPRGLTLLVDSDVPLGGGVSSSAAIEVATMTALSSLLGVTMRPLELAVACQQVENQVVGAPCGVMDQVASCLGHPGAMIRILCQKGADGLPAQIVGDLPVPEGYALVGIYSGVSHDVSGDPYTDTRVAAFMAQKILSNVDGRDVTAGHLANVDAAEFSRRWAAMLPERMAGRAFLDRYGGTNDPVTKVDPDREYTVRAAATHHALDSQRVRDFVASVQAGEVQEAGRLMTQTHRSYSECANLGHPMTDKLVDMALQAGALGAKITGGGCGGTVAILIRDDASARAAIAELRDAYTRQTGHQTLYFDGSSPGAAATGALTLRLGELP